MNLTEAFSGISLNRLLLKMQRINLHHNDTILLAVSCNEIPNVVCNSPLSGLSPTELPMIAYLDMDLAFAKYLCSTNPQPLETICYLCRQSAEKA